MPDTSDRSPDHAARGWRDLADGYRWRPSGAAGRPSEGVTLVGPTGVTVTLTHDGAVLVLPA
ncbi:hypothetical protein Acsp06_41440 [Actinomycetospora sp. NBRC 106375]|uniref:hypothetical protein n=1 Tax=Actinomycetospora sp. NBRC 106375 TaxID=3032207 RepID=UPI0024A28043|nr:hypothetical protein [Actinomycetospora sp. NBRC 106375]GLZ47959.1 hypothetical protein Acsp06_41440 [Actinomycetospora sp. NBRC 106375]